MKFFILSGIIIVILFYCNAVSANDCLEFEACFDVANISIQEYKTEKGSENWCSLFDQYFGCVYWASTNCSVNFCSIQNSLDESRDYCLQDCNTTFRDKCFSYMEDCPTTENGTTTSTQDSTTENGTTTTQGPTTENGTTATQGDDLVTLSSTSSSTSNDNATKSDTVKSNARQRLVYATVIFAVTIIGIL